MKKSKIPKQLVWAVVAVCVLPLLLNLVGVDFGSPRLPLEVPAVSGMASHELTDAMHRVLSGSHIHTLLEWSAFCVAIFTVFLAFIHFKIARDITTPVIGVALFFAGCMDAFHTLAADRLIDSVADNRNLIPFTWAICRLFNALIMIVGVGILLLRKSGAKQRGPGFVMGISLVFGLAAYGIIHVCATTALLPQTMFPDSLVTRPYDVIPLVLFLFAGIIVYPRFYRKTPSLFSHAVMISAIPEVATQLYMAFGSTALFDNHFNIAHFFKIIAYLVPLVGLALDYVETHREQRLVVAQLEEAQQILKTRTMQVEQANQELRIEIFERKWAEKTLQERNALVQLLQSVTAAANEASTVQEAMQVCLDQICGHTGWSVGHVYVPAEDSSGELVSTTIWHFSHTEKFEAFRKMSEATRFAPGIGLPGRVFFSGKPAWIKDVTKDPTFLRARASSDIHVRGAFSFPVLVGSKVAAVLEFYSAQPQEIDEKLLQAITYLSTQLGRVIERKQAEENLQALAARLEQSNHALQNFASVAAHDLKEPLRKVLMFGDRLQAKCNQVLTDQGRDYLDRMLGAAARMQILIDDLLAYSQVTTAAQPFVPVNLVKVVQEVLFDLEVRIAQEGALVEIGALPTIDADPTQMRQLLQNLISNALKFHREKEIPVVSIRGKVFNDRMQPPEGNSLGDGLCQIIVEDNGIGFDQKYTDRIFGVFQRLHGRQEYEGAGIGLALCRRIAERHGGSITAKSAPGQGATFMIDLPIKQRHEENAA